MQTPRSPAQTPGFPARRAALRLLDAVLRRGETLDQAERPALRDLASGPDRALARALASEVLRWLADLDTLIDSATKNILPDDAKARSVLRIMLAGWLRLETPPHAIIATGLPLLAGGPRRLAHGVFSTLVKQDVTLPDYPTLPPDVTARWGSAGAAIAQGLADPPPLDLTLRQSEDTQILLDQMREIGGCFSLAPGHIRVPRGIMVEQIPGYSDGLWWVQDFAASLPARLLGEGRHRRVLDLCAAPGGKTMQLAANGWHVTALDISKRRSEKLRKNLGRTGLDAQIIIANALDWEPDQLFDAILLDAPCTATGTCRRHPDVLHRINSRQIDDMAVLQERLLGRPEQWLSPGGVLVYATCSLETEEGEQQAENVTLARFPFTMAELPAGLKPDANGWLRTTPAMLADKGGIDGFFIARWKALSH